MAELTINTGDITAAIRKNLEGFTPDTSLTQVGRVVEVGDGIARVSGLPDAAVNELLEFESGVVGLALNLDEESIGAVVLGEVDSIVIDPHKHGLQPYGCGCVLFRDHGVGKLYKHEAMTRPAKENVSALPVSSTHHPPMAPPGPRSISR